MREILISTRPKWCEKICHVIGKDEMGKPIYEKRIEVRKSAPKEVPFKAYIYCTKDKPYLYRVDDDNNFELTNTLRPKTYEYVKDYNEQNGKVIGEFICDKVDEYSFSHYEAEYRVTRDEQKAMCLNHLELIRYGKGKTLCGWHISNLKIYGWHISDLKIYDKPKELSEFCGRKKLTRPPQSWQYVEELGNE